MQNYIISSIETHLFFARIMKEHALFLEAGFPCCNETWIQRCEQFKERFEDLLLRTVKLANETISTRALESGELFTPFTLAAEQATERLSGICINNDITDLTCRLRAGNFRYNDRAMMNQVHQLNQQALPMIRELMEFKESILREVQNQRLYTTNYPLLIEHILREARLYHATVDELLRTRQLSPQNRYNIETFWNQIMMEHALFIRGLLDPCEEELVSTAHHFSQDFRELLNQANRQDCRATEYGRSGSHEKTREFREFKATGTKGILEGNVTSVILPLLADHVLREANHYLRILEDAEQPTRYYNRRA